MQLFKATDMAATPGFPSYFVVGLNKLILVMPSIGFAAGHAYGDTAGLLATLTMMVNVFGKLLFRADENVDVDSILRAFVSGVPGGTSKANFDLAAKEMSLRKIDGFECLAVQRGRKGATMGNEDMKPGPALNDALTFGCLGTIAILVLAMLGCGIGYCSNYCSKKQAQNRSARVDTSNNTANPMFVAATGQQLYVECPVNGVPGSVVQLTHDGQTLHVTVPPGVSPGQSFPVNT